METPFPALALALLGLTVTAAPLVGIIARATRWMNPVEEDTSSSSSSWACLLALL
ncbi:hypothetical protein [Kocuria rosea]|uniref:hypothetical protein n=1 Tax=Kocuria rosea TaxID=1275 RepID=UPI0025403F0E|nr:hypothetical protein [Kocuria rosea]WIG16352.1 hypothetical protein QOY29_11760 [Kocuria rosea]